LENQYWETQQPQVFRKYCPFRQSGDKCSGQFCALWIDGLCAFTMIGAYFYQTLQQMLPPTEQPNEFADMDTAEIQPQV
jgi:hypothetical protein